MMARVLPWLVCVELRAQWMTPGAALYSPAAAQIVTRLRRLLKHARENDWTVAHVQSRARRVTGGPIAGLEPLSHEPVYLLDEASAFSAPRFAERATDDRPIVYFAGFAVTDIIVPSLLSGCELGLNMVLVEDAIAQPRNQRWSAVELVGLLKILLTPVVTSTSAEIMKGREEADVVNIRDFVRRGDYNG